MIRDDEFGMTGPLENSVEESSVAVPAGSEPGGHPRKPPPSLSRSTAGNAATDVVLLAIGALTGALVARWLLPEGRGALAAALLWPGFLLGVFGLSINEATTFLIGRNPEKSARIAVSAMAASLAVGVAVLVGGWFSIPLLLGSERAGLVGLARLYLVIYVPFQTIGVTVLATSQGELRFARYNVLRGVVPVVYFAAIVGLWFFDVFTVEAVVLVNGASIFLAAIYRVSVYRGEWWGVGPDLDEVKALLLTATKFHPATALTVLASQVDRVMVLAQWDNEILGKYVVAQTIASSAILMVSTGFYRALFPHLSQTQGSKDQAALLSRGVRALTILLVLIAGATYLVMPWLVPAVFGVAFADIILPARILLLGYMLVALRNVLIFALKGMGHGTGGLIAMTISILGFVILVPLFGQEWGITGIATAMTLANLTAALYLAAHLKRHHQVRPVDLWGLRPSTVGEVQGALHRLWRSRFRSAEDGVR